MIYCSIVAFQGMHSAFSKVCYKNIDPLVIAKTVSGILNVRLHLMMSSTRRRRVVDSRSMAYQIMFLYNSKLFREEAAAVFNRHHSTVTHSVYNHSDLMKSNPKYRETYLMLEKKIILQLGEPKTGSNAS